MKLKKLTALLSTVAMMSTVAPMAMAAEAPVYTFDSATNTFVISDTVVPGDIKVKEAGAADSEYKDSITLKFDAGAKFDLKASLDMTPVKEKFDAAVDIIKTKGKYDDFKDRIVKGEFTVTVIPDSRYMTIPNNDKMGLNMYGFTTDSDIYRGISRTMDGANLVIKVELRPDVTVAELAEANSLADIAYTSLEVPVIKTGTIYVKGTVNGWIETEDLQGDDDYNVKANFVAKENGKEVISAVIKPKTSGGLGGGGSTTTKKKATVTFYNGTEKHLEETVDITKGAYTFDVGAVAVPEAEKNKVFTGWYEDKECTIKADAKESITKDTDFYAGWADTKYKIEYKIDGVDAPVNTGMTGSVVIDNNDVVVNEDDSTTVNLSEIKAVGVQIVGWYLDPEHKIPADPSETVNTDTIFYAVTKPIVVPPILEKDDHFAYIIGYPEGDVRPENSITREEVATIFFRLLTEETRVANMGKSETFADVEMTRWSNNAISTMSKLGIVNGYEDGTFGPAKAITRAEFATIAARFEEEVAVGSENFTDIADHWAEEYIKEAAALQWVNGYEDGSFKPQKYITRAEVMTIVNRMLQRSVSSEYILEDAVFWSDNADTAWYYEAVMEATNSHEYERLAEGLIEERWTAMKANRDWSELEK